MSFCCMLLQLKYDLTLSQTKQYCQIHHLRLLYLNNYAMEVLGLNESFQSEYYHSEKKSFIIS